YSGEAYAYGIEMYLFIVGIACGVGVAGVVCLPVLYPLKLTSVTVYCSPISFTTSASSNPNSERYSKLFVHGCLFVCTNNCSGGRNSHQFFNLHFYSWSCCNYLLNNSKYLCFNSFCFRLLCC
ncbi:hypothetical protein Avbf_16231, partial [Armadillidium vulgare]